MESRKRRRFIAVPGILTCSTKIAIGDALNSGNRGFDLCFFLPIWLDKSLISDRGYYFWVVSFPLGVILKKIKT